MLVLDHQPVTMSMEFPTTQSWSPILRLDPSLLTDTFAVHTIQNRLTQYFTENDSPDISPLIQWEAHKCSIRGEFMAIAAKKRREKQAHILQLTTRIHKLEKVLKRTQVIFTLQELTQVRVELVDVLHKRRKCNYILSQKMFYEYGNKAGRFLARAL